LNYTTANTWQKFTYAVTIPNTLLNINRGTGIAAAFGVGSINAVGGGRTTVAATQDAWSTDYGNIKYTLGNATNWAAASGNYIQITGLKISRSPNYAFSLAGRDSISEFMLCQRYYETMRISSHTYFGLYTTSPTGAIFYGGPVPFAVTKRVAPLTNAENLGSWHWVQPGVGRFSADNTLGGTTVYSGPENWWLKQVRPAGNSVPTNGNVYTLEANFNILADAEL
jgi:hypothetical protein